MAAKRAFASTLILSVSLLAGVAAGGDRLLIPEDVDYPFYAEGLGHTADGSWVVTAFVRSPDCVPAGADPIGLDPNIDPDCELFVEGSGVFQEDSSEPVEFSLQNRPGELVPIWFVSGSDFLAALRDNKTPGIVTIKEMEAMDSLRIGQADSFSERFVTGHNGDASASGLMENGQQFFVRAHVTNVGGEGLYSVTVTFDE